MMAVSSCPLQSLEYSQDCPQIVPLVSHLGRPSCAAEILEDLALWLPVFIAARGYGLFTVTGLYKDH